MSAPVVLTLISVGARAAAEIIKLVKQGWFHEKLEWYFAKMTDI